MNLEQILYMPATCNNILYLRNSCESQEDIDKLLRLISYAEGTHRDESYFEELKNYKPPIAICKRDITVCYRDMAGAGGCILTLETYEKVRERWEYCDLWEGEIVDKKTAIERTGYFPEYLKKYYPD